MTSLPAWHGEPTPSQNELLSQLAAMPAGEPFTTDLRQPRLARSVSAVIATFNRSPFDPDTRLADNPLYWAVTSLRGQAGDALAEIVVVDDGSTDHTPAVLAHLAGLHHPVPVRVIRLDTHAGACRARNSGAEASRCRWLYYSDDDCIAAPHATAGAAYVLAELTRRDDRAGALMTSCYYRTLRPAATLPRERIGVLHAASADFATGFHAMPADYLAPDPPVLGAARVLAPLPVGLIGGTALIDRDALARAGGFADLSYWRSGYADHLHLSADLAGAGARLYHCPDPRLSAVHLKFGAAGRYPAGSQEPALVPCLGRPLAELIVLSSVPRTYTGHRLPDSLFFPEQIGSFFAFFAARSASGGLAWALRSWREFVLAGAAPTLAVTEIPPLPGRIAAWRAGLASGAVFLSTTARPGLSRDQVSQMLKEITSACAQPPITRW